MSLVGYVIIVIIGRDARLPSLQKISCVECPLDKGAYIAVADCRKCPYWLKDAGKTVECGYTFKKLSQEPAKDKEYEIKW